MRALLCFIYVSLTILYCLYKGDMSLFMYGVGQFTILAFVIALCSFILIPKPLSEIDSLFIQYSCFMTIARVVYTIFCMFNDKTIVVYNTDLFGGITAITFLVFLLYSAYQLTFSKSKP